MRRLATIGILLALAAPACDLFDDDDDVLGPLPFETIDVAELAVSERGTDVFRDAGSWAEFYCLNKVTDDICDPPVFDFDTTMLIVVAWGPGASGCTDRTRSIASIERTRVGIEVTVVDPTDLGECAAIVAPWQLVRLARSAAPVTVLGLEPSVDFLSDRR